jgi:hypothetical protein
MDLISDPCTKQCFGKRRVASDDVPGEITRSLDDPNPPPVVRNWVVQAARDEGRRPDGLTTDEKEEVRRLRREVRVLREEREILRNGRARHRPSHLLREKLAMRLC